MKAGQQCIEEIIYSDDDDEEFTEKKHIEEYTKDTLMPCYAPRNYDLWFKEVEQIDNPVSLDEIMKHEEDEQVEDEQVMFIEDDLEMKEEEFQRNIVT